MLIGMIRNYLTSYYWDLELKYNAHIYNYSQLQNTGYCGITFLQGDKYTSCVL